jgi:hypothetical protein
MRVEKLAFKRHKQDALLDAANKLVGDDRKHRVASEIWRWNWMAMETEHSSTPK